MSVEENHTSLTFDNPTENRQIIETILEELVDLDDLKKLNSSTKISESIIKRLRYNQPHGNHQQSMPTHARIAHHCRKPYKKRHYEIE